VCILRDTFRCFIGLIIDLCMFYYVLIHLVDVMNMFIMLMFLLIFNLWLRPPWRHGMGTVVILLKVTGFTLALTVDMEMFDHRNVSPAGGFLTALFYSHSYRLAAN